MKRIIPFALLVALAACQLPFSEPHGQVSVSFVVPEAPPSFEGVGRILDGRIGRMVVSVSIPGGPTLTGETLISQAPGSTQTLTVNLVPAGTGRTVTVTAFNAANTEILSGTTANVTVVAGQQVPVSLSLVPSNNQFVDLGDPAWRLESLGVGSTVNLSAGGLRYLKFTAPGAGTYDFDLLDTAGVSLKFYDATGKTLSNQVATNRSFAAGEVQWIQVSAAQGATLNAASLLRVFGAPLAVTDRAGLKSAKIDLVTKLGDFGADLTAAQALEGTGPGQYLPAILTGASTNRDAAQTALTGFVASVAAQTADLDLAQTWLDTGANPVLTGFSSTPAGTLSVAFNPAITEYTLELLPENASVDFAFTFAANSLASFDYAFDSDNNGSFEAGERGSATAAQLLAGTVTPGALNNLPAVSASDTAPWAEVSLSKPSLTIDGVAVTPASTYRVRVFRPISDLPRLATLTIREDVTDLLASEGPNYMTDPLDAVFSPANFDYQRSVPSTVSSLTVEASLPGSLVGATLDYSLDGGTTWAVTAPVWSLVTGSNVLKVRVTLATSEVQAYTITVVKQTAGTVTVEWPTEVNGGFRVIETRYDVLMQPVDSDVADLTAAIDTMNLEALKLTFPATFLSDPNLDLGNISWFVGNETTARLGAEIQFSGSELMPFGPNLSVTVIFKYNGEWYSADLNLNLLSQI